MGSRLLSRKPSYLGARGSRSTPGGPRGRQRRGDRGGSPTPIQPPALTTSRSLPSGSPRTAAHSALVLELTSNRHRVRAGEQRPILLEAPRVDLAHNPTSRRSWRSGLRCDPSTRSTRTRRACPGGQSAANRCAAVAQCGAGFDLNCSGWGSLLAVTGHAPGSGPAPMQTSISPRRGCRR